MNVKKDEYSFWGEEKLKGRTEEANINEFGARFNFAVRFGRKQSSTLHINNNRKRYAFSKFGSPQQRNLFFQ